MGYGADARDALLDFDLGSAPVVEPFSYAETIEAVKGELAARREARQAGQSSMRAFAQSLRWSADERRESSKPPSFVDAALRSSRDADGHHFVRLRGRGCGELYAIRATCSDVLCVECMKRKADAARRRWLPVLEKMRSPKLMTLTLSGDRLGVSGAEDVRRALQDAYRRFFDLSLGARNLKALLDEARSFVQRADLDQQARFLVELDRLEKRIRRRWHKSDEPVRIRDLLGYGFRSIEITRGANGDHWHFHIHAALDMPYLPQPFLRAAWLRATRGAGEIVDVRQIGRGADDIAEVAKYLTKSWELPDGLADELRNAIYGMQRVKAIGSAKPADEHVCPCCGDPECRAQRVGHEMVTLGLVHLEDGRRAALVDDAGRQVWLVEEGAVWREARGPLLDKCAIELQRKWRPGVPWPPGASAQGPPGGPGG